jgi:hypothetical protein
MFREETARANPMRRERKREMCRNSRGKTSLRIEMRPGRALPAAEMMLTRPLPSVISPTARTRKRPEDGLRPSELAWGLMGPSSLLPFQDSDPDIGRVGIHDHEKRFADLIIGDVVSDAIHGEVASPFI